MDRTTDDYPKIPETMNNTTDSCFKTEKRPNIIKYHKARSDKQVNWTKVKEAKSQDRVTFNNKSKPKGYGTDTNLTLACLVFFCFNLPMGAVAMYLSLSAAKAYRDGEEKVGEKKAKYSVFVSLFSIVTTVLVVMAIVLWVVVDSQNRRELRQRQNN